MQEDDGSPRFRSGMQPLSKVPLGQIVGLLKNVEEAGGDADVAEIARASDIDLNQLPPVVDAAVFLGLAQAGEGDLSITPLGRKVLAAGLRQRKAILRGIIQQLPGFQRVTERIVAAGRPLSRQEVIDALAAQVGSHEADGFFTALVAWGRYTELLTYDSRSELLGLRTPAPAAPPKPPMSE